VTQTKLNGQSTKESSPKRGLQLVSLAKIRSAPGGPLTGRHQIQRQGMYRSSELGREDGVNAALPLDTRQSGEGSGFNLHAKMAFAAGPGAGMAGMETGLIDHGQMRGVERLAELGLDRLRHGFVHHRLDSCLLKVAAARRGAPDRRRVEWPVLSIEAALPSALTRINLGDAAVKPIMDSEILERPRG